MKKSKAFLLLNALDEKELKELEQMMESSFFHQNEAISSLFTYLKKNRDSANKKEWYSLYFKDRGYDDLVVRRYLSSLNGILEEYLTIKELKAQKYVSGHLLFSALRKRRLVGHLKSKSSFGSMDLKYKDMDYSSDVFLAGYRFFCENDRLDSDLDKRKPLENMEEGLLYLDLYYIVEKLRNICEIYNSKTIFELENISYLNEEVIELAKQAPFNAYPQVRLYSFLLETIRSENNEEAFRVLQKLADEHGTLLSRTEERDVYLVLVNYCIRNINKGVSGSLEECFRIYKIMEKKNLLIKGKFLSPWTYKNIITAALRLNETEWTRQFIRSHKEKLSEEHRENAYNYNLAKYNFHLGNYDKVLDYLQKVEYEDVFYGLDARSLMMKVFYLDNEMEALYSLTDSFRIYLRRKKKIPKERRKTYLNFIKFIRKLIKLSPRDYPGLRKLRNDIQATDKVADRIWILGEVENKIRKVEAVYKN